MTVVDTCAALGLVLLSVGLAAAGLVRGEHRSAASGPLQSSPAPRPSREPARPKHKREARRVQATPISPGFARDQAMIEAGLISPPRGNGGKVN